MAKSSTKTRGSSKSRPTDLEATRSEGFFSGSVRRSAQAMAAVAGGFAGAIGDGIRVYGQTLSEVDPTRLAVNNGFVVGTLAGYATFFEGMASSAREAIEVVSDAPALSLGGSSGVEIDYEKLAREISTDELAKKIAQILKKK